MGEAYRYYWFHLVPAEVAARHGGALLPEHLRGLPRVALEQSCYARFALPYLARVAPARGGWGEVLMGQDVLLDATASGGLRRACAAMLARLDAASPAELRGVLETLVGFADRLGEGGAVLLVAHWPQREIAEVPLATTQPKRRPRARRA